MTAIHQLLDPIQPKHLGLESSSEALPLDLSEREEDLLVECNASGVVCHPS
jgi:hypothetical protein